MDEGDIIVETYVKMSLDEFNQLKETREEPSRMLQDSYNNVKAKLDLAYKQIDELNASLSMYVIGGARMNPPIEEVEKIIQIIADDEPKETERANKGWSAIEVSQLIDWVDTENTVAYMSAFFGRTESAIRSKVISLGYRIKHKRIVST